MRVLIGAAALFLLVWGNQAHAVVINPSFESGTLGWASTSVGRFGAGVTGAFATDGIRSYRIFSQTTCASSFCGRLSFSNGQFRSLSQSIDLTSVDELLFDTTLDSSGGATAYQSFIRAAVYLGSTLIWSSQTHGTVTDIAVDTSAISGNVALSFALEATGSGVDSQSDWFFIDNIRAAVVAVPAPHTIWLVMVGLFALARRRRAEKIVQLSS
ncbi:MAG: PEP-CTERM sorting domain-containing protein [Pseudomonadota bacterium]